MNFSFRFVEGEALVLTLGLKGICASSGSACTSGETDPSHVLRAIGLEDEEAGGSLRMTLSEENTREEIDITVDRLKETVQKLREMNFQYETFLKKSISI